MIDLKSLTLTIAEGASLSGAIDCTRGRYPGRIVMPAAWTAAALTFQVSDDGTTYRNLYDEYGTEVTVQAAASRDIRLEPANWFTARYLKIRSGTSGTPVNQAAARTLTVITRSY